MRKKSLALTLFFLTTTANAKFAREVFDMPCEQLTFSANSCEPLTLNPNPKKGELSYTGVIVDANVSKVELVKCHPKQNMRPELVEFHIETGPQKLFINKGDCKKLPTTVIVPRQFCDTPGAMSVPECFVQKMQSKLGFIFSK